MGYLSEFNALHAATRRFLIGLCVLMPFWYIAMYLFSRLPIDKLLIVPVIAAFCLSVLWLGLHFVVHAMYKMAFPVKKVEEQGKDEGNRILEDVVMYSIGYLAILILIGYLGHYRFHSFIYVAFGFAVSRCVFYILFTALKEVIRQRQIVVEEPKTIEMSEDRTH